MTNNISDETFYNMVEDKYKMIIEHTTKGILLNNINFTFPQYKEQATQRGYLNYEITHHMGKLKTQQKNYYKKNDSWNTKLKKMFSIINTYNSLMEVVDKYNNLKDIIPTQTEFIGMVSDLRDELYWEYTYNQRKYYKEIEDLYDKFDNNIPIYCESKIFKKKYQTDCPICLEKVTIGINLKCSHLIHCDCLSDYKKSNANTIYRFSLTRIKCPVCRQDLNY